MIGHRSTSGATRPARPAWSHVVLAWAGSVLAIGLLAQIGSTLAIPLLLGSFGASCVLVFGYPELPFSQPRHVIVGHTLSTGIGLLFLTSFGPSWWALALAVGTAVAVMMLTRTVHPPAGSNPVIVFLAQPSWQFLVSPTLSGAVLLVLVALLYHNVLRRHRYPTYW